MGADGSRVARRSFFSRVGAGAAGFATVFGVGGRPVLAQSPERVAGSWHPTRHAEDDWFEETSAKHRFFFDTTSPSAFGEALLYANNFFIANRNGYGLADGDLAVVLCARHGSTMFAFDDAVWAKYGEPIGELAKFVDPKTNAAPTRNVYLAADSGLPLLNRGVTLDALFKRGVRLAVCDMATRAYAGMIAAKTGGKVDDVYKELTDHLLPNGHLVPAGIVAVNRAQERGYSFAYTG